MLLRSLGILGVLPVTILAFSSGPPDGYAGDPPLYNYCTACHTSYPLNSGDGVLEILGLPTFYLPGSTYVITVHITDPGQVRWGFELTVIDTAGTRGGFIAPLDSLYVQVSQGADRDYAKHTLLGTFPGQSEGLWSIMWTAPSQGTGRVEFYLAGNAANNNGNPYGDYIYAVNYQVEEQFTPGDANGNGTVDALDLAYLANFFFGGGEPPDPLLRGDTNGVCSVNAIDLTYLASYLFIGGPAPQLCQM
jgi:hypothetical protein